MAIHECGVKPPSRMNPCPTAGTVSRSVSRICIKIYGPASLPVLLCPQRHPWNRSMGLRCASDRLEERAPILMGGPLPSTQLDWNYCGIKIPAD
jgi:hypothetical protein